MSKKKCEPEEPDFQKKIIHIKCSNGYELWIDASQYKSVKYWDGYVTLNKRDGEKPERIGNVVFVEDADTKAKELELLLDKVNSKLDYFIDFVTDESWMDDLNEYQEFKYWKENVLDKHGEKVKEEMEGKDKGGTSQYNVSVNPIPANNNPESLDLTDTKERVFYMPDNSNKDKRELLDKFFENVKK